MNTTMLNITVLNNLWKEARCPKIAKIDKNEKWLLFGVPGIDVLQILRF